MYKLYITLLLFCIQTISAQQLRQPFNFPILLSGNFGELRNNHFHSGIDFKTQGTEGKPVHAVQDGYVSRISVSPWGYGNGLYLTHPDGTTTVYGHLQRFAPSIARYLKAQQYEQESFNVNLFPTPDQLPVKKEKLSPTAETPEVREVRISILKCAIRKAKRYSTRSNISKRR